METNWKSIDRVVTALGECFLVSDVEIKNGEPVAWVAEMDGGPCRIPDDHVAFYLEYQDELTLGDLVEALGTDWKVQPHLVTGEIIVG